MRFEIDPDKCVSCLACVRVCAARAISVDGDSVTIEDEVCIRSGSCLPECPHDAIRAVGIPTVEVHISDIESREEWRQRSVIRPACIGSIAGHGIEGYREAMELLEQSTEDE